MNVIQATHTKPDAENEISFECELAIENKTKDIIELIRTSCLLLNNEGVVVEGSLDNESDVYIEENETGKFSLPMLYWVNLNLFGAQAQSKYKMIVDALMFRRDFYDLGEIEVPVDEKEPSISALGFKLGDFLKIYGVYVSREKPEDGEVTVYTRVAIRNEGDTHFEKVLLKAALIEKLRNDLDENSRKMQLQRKAEESDAMKNTLGQVPLPIYIA